MPSPAVHTTPELDQEYLTRAQDGDREAFARIVRHYENMVYSFSFKVCRNREYAEETLQDTFVNVYRKLKQFDGKSKFSTWIYSIVANNCLMKRRRSRLEASSVSLDAHGDLEHGPVPEKGGAGVQPLLLSRSSSPLETAIRSELRERLDAAIQKLPVDFRLVFLLRDIEGRTAAETAKIMNLTIPAVKSRLRRARVFLREQLDEYMSS